MNYDKFRKDYLHGEIHKEHIEFLLNEILSLSKELKLAQEAAADAIKQCDAYEEVAERTFKECSSFIHLILDSDIDDEVKKVVLGLLDIELEDDDLNDKPKTKFVVIDGGKS